MESDGTENPVYAMHQVSYDIDLDIDSDHYMVETLDDDPLIAPLDSDDGNGEQVRIDDERDRRHNLSLCASFYKRRFVGETSGSLAASEMMIGDSVEDILRAVWTIVKPMIHREVVFVGDSGNQIPTWAESEPSFDDMWKFVYMQNHQNRRRINIEQISSKLLISWKDKDIRVHVHIYSTSVSCKQLWELVDKQLVKFQQTDRAGAPSNLSLSQLAGELQELHGNHFAGHASSWNHTSAWREQKKAELPPHSIIKFFRSVPVSEAVRMESARTGLSVASTINDAFSTGLAEIEEEATQLIVLAQRLKHRVSALRTRSSINSSLVSAMQESVRPEEDEISRSIADNVSDMLDVDHM
ncbi:uncharacterized protein LOC134217295 [Armigeres subalbatus]|uniref:uncharacterized protein LOC134217295 n=1 Tax=Armigeres subalbatus TaxID=124917 RepID=UPI002ED5CCBA